jgi:tetratricopeptide (TPR) repeat protein
MAKRLFELSAILVSAWALGACSGMGASRQLPWELSSLVGHAQKAVVTVAATDLDGEGLRIGSGFFIQSDGILVTNNHVLDGAFKAQIKTADGEKYPITTVIARNPQVDLMKVRVAIPAEKVVPVQLADDAHSPAIADRVVVIGSPMGFEQTVSEGIISAVRQHPAGGQVYQLTAPISQGSSGGPVLNLKGQVVGVVTFQAASGQNLNFAVSAKALRMMPNEIVERSLAQWALEKAANDPFQAMALCRQGAELSIKGQYDAALEFYQQAAETNPDDAETWRGLGSCYIGLNQPDEAIAAFHHSIDAAPNDAIGHFMLAMYYKALENYPEAIAALLQVIRIDPANVQARFELADAYGRVDQTEEQIQTFRGILNLKPDHVPALQRLAEVVGGLGSYDEALDLLHQASSLAPDNAEIYFDIGVIYNSQKLPEKELGAYIQAIRLDPQLVSAHYNLALLYLSQGNRNLALQEYTILKTLDPRTAERLFQKIYPETIEEIRQSGSTP